MLLLGPGQKPRGEALGWYVVRGSHVVVEWKSEGEGTDMVELKKGRWLEGVYWLGAGGVEGELGPCGERGGR